MDIKNVIEQILGTALKVSTEKEQVIELFDKAGIMARDDGTVTLIKGDHMDALRTLMEKLSAMAVVKISAKQVLRKAGIKL